MTTLATRLGTLGAYRDLIAWCEPYGDDDARAIAECPRGDWVIAIAVAIEAPRARIVRAACACAALATELVDPSAIVAATDAITAARTWSSQETQIDRRVIEACQALTDHPDPLVQSAAIAGLACLLAIDDPREAPAAAASAVATAALHAADCGAMAAVSYTYARSAELARVALAG